MHRIETSPYEYSATTDNKINTMPEYLRSLLIIIFFSLIVFKLTEMAFEDSFEEGELSQWRKTWILMITIPFFAGNFWLYIIANALVLIYSLKKVDDRLPFFLVLLIVVPPYMKRIPGLFEVDHVVMLSLIILAPILLSKELRPNTLSLGKPLADKLILALILLVTLLSFRGTTPGDALRSGFVVFVGWFIPYFAASRMIRNFNHLKKVLIALVMACAIAGLVGAFENVKGRLVYEMMSGRLDVPGFGGWGLMRGDELRAMSSLSHPLILGFVMMLSFGIFLYLGSMIKTKKLRFVYFLIICAGLYSPVSRGPWAGAFITLLIFLSTGKKVVRNLTVLTMAFLIIIPILPGLPGGQKIIKLLPFFGTAEQFNVDYRKALIPRAFDILEREPFFGVFDTTKEPEMSDMVQGEGIVDIVNSYLNIALATGLVGLTLFIWFFLSITFQLHKSMRYVRDKKSEEYVCARSLLAVMLGMFVTISTVSFVGMLATYMFILAGIMFSYSRIIRESTRKSQKFGVANNLL